LDIPTVPVPCYYIDFVLLQETLSKIGIMSRMVGNQIRELVNSVAEIQSACQEELSVPVGGGASDNGRLNSVMTQKYLC
jgi:hypothetical protein